MTANTRRRLGRLESIAADDPNRRPYEERLAAAQHRYWDGTASVADYLLPSRDELEDIDAVLMVTVPQLVVARERKLELVLPWSVLAYAPNEEPPTEVLKALPEWLPWRDDIPRYKRPQDGSRLPPWRARERASEALVYARIASDQGLRLRRLVWEPESNPPRLKTGIPEPTGQHAKDQARNMRVDLMGFLQRHPLERT